MPFSLVQSLHTIPIACVDLETTGASADFGHRIIEIGIVRYENGQKIAEYQQLIDPQRPISAGVTALTGITKEMVAGQPTFADQFPAMLALLGNAAILGHNIRFDLSFLRRQFRSVGQDICEALCHAPVLDTVRIARKRFGRGGNGLGRLARRLGYEPAVAHRALDDAITTAIVFDRLLHPVGGWQLCLCDAFVQQGGPMGLLPANPRESLLPLELEEALERRKPVLMEYLDARSAPTQRVIQPIQIRRASGELLLIAHCHLRNDRRTFKLERIVRLHRLEEAATRMPANSPFPPDAATPLARAPDMSCFSMAASPQPADAPATWPPTSAPLFESGLDVLTIGRESEPAPPETTSNSPPGPQRLNVRINETKEVSAPASAADANAGAAGEATMR